jgi:phospholipase C
MTFTRTFLASLAAIAALTEAASLADIKHIVYFMQENRSFNHYFGTMAGVRNFQDPNVLQQANGKSVFYQATGIEEAPYLLPFYMSENQSYVDSNQCAIAGSNDWPQNHQAWDFGKIDAWVTNNSAYSWGYFERSDIPTHFDIAEGWTVGDMYAEAVIGPTCPNRATWVSGTINAQGALPGNITANGGNYIENYLTPGCEYGPSGIPYACYPLRWKTVPEYLEENNIDWFVFEQASDYGDNPLQWFVPYQTGNESSPLVQNGMSFTGMDYFFQQAAAGTLPAVSWVIGPIELSEHPPYRPVDGGWLYQNVVESVMNSPAYNETVIFISYDETGGYGDHVPPFVSPNGTTGEWIVNPEQPDEVVPTGPGFRVPFMAISPFTRGSNVFSEPADHNSQILFLEKWAKAAYDADIYVADMNPWRRQYMSNLVNMFDFENPDYSFPEIANAPEPDFVNNVSVSTSLCQQEYNNVQCPIPYGQQNETTALYAETGYKKVRGNLTEGRYLVFELVISGQSITLQSNFNGAPACNEYSCEDERFVVYQQGDAFSNVFRIQSASGQGWIGGNGDVQGPVSHSDSQLVTINYDAANGYTIQTTDGSFVTFSNNQPVSTQSEAVYFNIYAVSY